MAQQRQQFVMCVKNDGYAASLQLRKIYRVLPDRSAAAEGLVRVVDDSGEDYLYPDDWFVRLSFRTTMPRRLEQIP